MEKKNTAKFFRRGEGMISFFGLFENLQFFLIFLDFGRKELELCLRKTRFIFAGKKL